MAAVGAGRDARASFPLENRGSNGYRTRGAQISSYLIRTVPAKQGATCDRDRLSGSGRTDTQRFYYSA